MKRAKVVALALAMLLTPLWEGLLSQQTRVATFVGEVQGEIVSVEPGSEFAHTIVNLVCDQLGVDRVPVLMSELIPNAAAVLKSNGCFIVYNPAFLNQMAECSPHAAAAVLAHEVGHVYDFSNTPGLKDVSSWSQELRADFLSGYVMAKLGATIQQATSSHKCYWTEGGHTHPPSADRIRYIAKGWKTGKSTKSL